MNKTYLERVVELKQSDSKMPAGLIMRAFRSSKPSEIARYQLDHPDCPMLAEYRKTAKADYIEMVDIIIQESDKLPSFPEFLTELGDLPED